MGRACMHMSYTWGEHARVHTCVSKRKPKEPHSKQNRTKHTLEDETLSTETTADPSIASKLKFELPASMSSSIWRSMQLTLYFTMVTLDKDKSVSSDTVYEH